jgi:hypothetical protein
VTAEQSRAMTHRERPTRRPHDPMNAPEALALLAIAPYGRVVCTLDAHPAIRLPKHIDDGGQVIHAQPSAATARSSAWAPPTALAYEVDHQPRLEMARAFSEGWGHPPRQARPIR